MNSGYYATATGDIPAKGVGFLQIVGIGFSILGIILQKCSHDSIKVGAGAIAVAKQNIFALLCLEVVKGAYIFRSWFHRLNKIGNAGDGCGIGLAVVVDPFLFCI